MAREKKLRRQYLRRLALQSVTLRMVNSFLKNPIKRIEKEYDNFCLKKKRRIFIYLKILLLGWQMGLEPTTFRTTI